jgi:NADH dehydrogenase FAD-containing subunit
MDTRFVVLGSGYAGTLAAVRLAHRAGPGAVTLVDPELRLVERVRLHEALVHGREVAHGLAGIADRLGIRLVRGRAAQLDGHAVVLDDGERIAFEQCIVATGSRTARTLPGAAAHAIALEPGTLAEARTRLARASRVVVLGGGLTGIEIASEIAESMQGKQVTLVTSTLAPSLTTRARAYVERTLRRLGVALVVGRPIDRVEAGAVHAGDRVIAFDLAIDTTGFASEAPAFLDGPRDVLGRVRADAALRSLARADVVLAGDLAAPDGDLAGAPMIRGCQSAMPSGAHAADVAWSVANGRAPHAFRFVPNGYCVSLGRADGVVDAYGMVFTGGVAAWIKEQIVRYTVSSMHWQARGWDYRWRPFFGRAPRALPAPRRAAALTADAA